MSKVLFTIFFMLFLGAANAQNGDYEYDMNNVGDLNELGWDHMKKKEYDQAIELFTKSIQLDEDNLIALNGRAKSYYGLKMYQEAEEDVLMAIELSDNRSDIYNLAGNIYSRLRNHDKAIDYYSLALNHDDKQYVKIDRAVCHFNRGNAYLFSQKYQDAIDDFNITLETMVDFANAYHNRGIAYRHLYQKSPACVDFKAALHFGSEKTEYYVNDYCKGQVVKELPYDKLLKKKKSDSLLNFGYNPLPIPPEMVDTLYYDVKWELTKKSNSSYYRIANVKTKELIFTGDISEYYIRGKILLKGTYNHEGEKHGEFLRYFDSGILFSKGAYEKNRMVGIWEFYKEDGNLLERINFENNDFGVLDSFTEDNKPGVTNGTGVWTKLFPVSASENITLFAKFENGIKDGKWQVRDDNGQLLLTETFKDGNYIEGKSFDYSTGRRELRNVFSESQIKKEIFYPTSYASVESFEASTYATQQDYPYMTQLPPGVPAANKISTTKQSDDFRNVEDQPAPEGGMQAFYEYVGRSMRYPLEARRKKIEGRVFVQFVVAEDGSIIDVETVKGIGGGCDEEAERVLRLAPKWKPGLLDGKPVKVRMIIPITFKTS